MCVRCGGRGRRSQPARRSLKSLHKNNRAKPATISSCVGFTDSTSKKGPCDLSLSHSSNLTDLQGPFATLLATVTASHEELYRNDVRPIAARETRRRVRPKSRGLRKGQFFVLELLEALRLAIRALWHGLAATLEARDNGAESFTSALAYNLPCLTHRQEGRTQRYHRR
jgi:hypothetical protein